MPATRLTSFGPSWGKSNPDATPAAIAPEPVSDPGEGKLAAPEGTVSEVLAWVGDDPERAVAAMAGETRKTLIAQLEEITDA